MKFVFISLAFSLILSSESFAQDSPQQINNSSIAFTIPEKDLLPESVAFDPLREEFYIGSTRKGKIIKIAKDGKVSDFIKPKQDGLWMVIGIKVDPKSRVLWVCSSGGDNLEDYNLKDNVEGRPAGIFKFDLNTGKLIKKYILNTKGEVHFFNDLILDSSGNIYITHMFDEHSIYTIQREKDELELFLLPPNLKYPNGITISDDEQYLFIAHSEGIARIDIATKRYTELSNPTALKISGRESVDGLYYYNNNLVIVQPDIKSVQRLKLNEEMNSIIDSEYLEMNHPMMNNPTTGVISKNEFHFIANAQFGSFNEDGTLYPLEKLYEPTILKIILND